MRGSGFLCSHAYKIGYYDGGGIKVATEGQTSDGDGVLTGAYNLMTDSNATAGWWHSVVFESTGPLQVLPGTYAGALTDPNYVVDDAFNVGQAAIPEFPTALAAVFPVALCAGIYLWMRRRLISSLR